jgi:hypothetical protein
MSFIFVAASLARHPARWREKEIAMSSTQSKTGYDLKLEVVVIPVSDVDRAKRFYTNLGWRLDADFGFANGLRIVQFTPPGPATARLPRSAIQTTTAGCSRRLRRGFPAEASP